MKSQPIFSNLKPHSLNGHVAIVSFWRNRPSWPLITFTQALCPMMLRLHRKWCKISFHSYVHSLFGDNAKLLGRGPSSLLRTARAVDSRDHTSEVNMSLCDGHRLWFDLKRSDIGQGYISKTRSHFLGGTCQTPSCAAPHTANWRCVYSCIVDRVECIPLQVDFRHANPPPSDAVSSQSWSHK